jgi:large subunit ribosomal protein L5
MDATAPTARLKTRYLEEIRPALLDRFGYTSVMQAPRLEKITLNMGVGQAKQDSKMLRASLDQLATIAGQRPSVRRARKSVAAFKLREGMPVGVAVTLRSDRSYEFLDRLISIAIPRIRDFRGLSPRSFDGRGNYSLGVREQIIFPEVDYDSIDEVRGLDVTITTSASSDVEAFALLSALGMPFAARGRPGGFDEAAPDDAIAADGDERAEADTAQATSETEEPVAEEPAAEEPVAEEPAAAARAGNGAGEHGDGAPPTLDTTDGEQDAAPPNGSQAAESDASAVAQDGMVEQDESIEEKDGD